MVSILEEINRGLTETTGLYCYAEFPSDGFQLPLLIVKENSNRQSTIALDGRVEVADLTYMITIYSEDAEDIYQYQTMIDEWFFTNAKRLNGQIQPIQVSGNVHYRTLTYQGKVQRVGDNYYIL